LESGNFLERHPGLGTKPGIALRALAEADKKEGFSAGVIRYGLHVGGNIWKIRQVGLADKDALELRTNTGIGLIDFHGPWKGRSVIDRRVAVDRIFEIEALGPLH